MESLNPDSDMVTTLEVTCHLNGTYDLDIELFKCTSPCPPPTLKYPEIMEHDWSDMTLNLEIEEEVKFKCKDGYQLVSKGAFATGESDNVNFLDELTASCQINSELDSTIGSYTCTKPCQTPTNYSQVFNWDWDESKGTDIGMEIIYTCLDSNKQVANMEDSSYGILGTLTVTCLFNGNYDFNVLDWTCTDCLQRPNPPHSYFWCESNRLEVGSTCALTCDPGFIPLGITLMTCIYDKVSSHGVKPFCPRPFPVHEKWIYFISPWTKENLKKFEILH